MHRSPSRIARSEASMSADTPDVPAGSGQHPIVLVAISANDLAASTAFYSRLFGWQTQSIAPDLTACDAADGPGILLSANMPDGFPGVVPFVAVSEVGQRSRAWPPPAAPSNTHRGNCRTAERSLASRTRRQRSTD
jgi:hypothetical protein